MTNDSILDVIVNSFVESAKQYNFNGVLASSLLKYQPDPDGLRAELAVFIQKDQVSAVFSRQSVNIYIKRLSDISIEKQLELVAEEPLNAFCLYPTSSTIQDRLDLSAWQGRPFSKALLLAEPQLSFRAFDMGALERYTADPRYTVDFNDYMGWMSVSDVFFSNAQYPERDKVSLQTFGIGFNQQHDPYAIVFLRYLAGLSAEHQQYWNSYLADGDVRMSKPYYLSSIEGQFWENHSVRYAIVEEMRLIHSLSEAIWGRSLFRVPPEDKVPIGLTSFLRPTAENFNGFVMALDKLLSESIDVKFFEGKISLETETERSDGKIVVQRKGTLTLLEEWLLQEIVWKDKDAFREIIIQPLRDIRRIRQTPAHAFTSNTFSADYRDKRKRLMWRVFSSLSNIRATFAKHPSGRNVEIPDWLDGDDIDVF